MTDQKYEKYWSCTLAFTDIYGTKFTRYLNIIREFIDTYPQKVYSEKKYEALQQKIQNVFNLNFVSIRKAINQFVKLGFVSRDLSSYHKDLPAFLNSSGDKRRSIFSKIVYSFASLDNSVTHPSDRKEINFLVKTLSEVKRLDKSDIMGLMTTDITDYPKGFLNTQELQEARRYAEAINFHTRKYNQLQHFCSVLKKLDDLEFRNDAFTLKDDASIFDRTDDEEGVLDRDPYLHRIYKNQLKSESVEKFRAVCCMLDGLAHPSLVASHIKPFRKCNQDEAYDPGNGLLLSRTNDQYFDAGYISFEDNGRIILSGRLTEDVKQDIQRRFLDPKFLTPERLRYLKYHREFVFK